MLTEASAKLQNLQLNFAVSFHKAAHLTTGVSEDGAHARTALTAG
jgi:hypothetical protein